MGYAPAMAIPKALERAGTTIDEIDIIELNEAFAAQAVAVAETLQAAVREAQSRRRGDRARPSGRCDRRDPDGQADARARANGRALRLVSMCIGGGQGFAAVFERP